MPHPSSRRSQDYHNSPGTSHTKQTILGLQLQTQGVFNRTLEAMKKAGAVIVPFNASAMVDYHDKYIGDSTFYTTELGGALSRCACSKNSGLASCL